MPGPWPPRGGDLGEHGARDQGADHDPHRVLGQPAAPIGQVDVEGDGSEDADADEELMGRDRNPAELEKDGPHPINDSSSQVPPPHRVGQDLEAFPNGLATMWFHLTEDETEVERIFQERLLPTIRRRGDPSGTGCRSALRNASLRSFSPTATQECYECSSGPSPTSFVNANSSTTRSRHWSGPDADLPSGRSTGAHSEDMIARTRYRLGSAQRENPYRSSDLSDIAQIASARDRHLWAGVAPGLVKGVSESSTVQTV